MRFHSAWSKRLTFTLWPHSYVHIVWNSAAAAEIDSSISCVACVHIDEKYASHGSENFFGAERAIRTAKLICCICAGVALNFPSDRSCGTESLLSPLLAVGLRFLASVSLNAFSVAAGSGTVSKMCTGDDSGFVSACAPSLRTGVPPPSFRTDFPPLCCSPLNGPFLLTKVLRAIGRVHEGHKGGQG